jgi:hypothetical protein
MENDGVIAGVSAGKVIIDCATLSPERMQLESDKIIEKYALDIAFNISIIPLSFCAENFSIICYEMTFFFFQLSGGESF